MFERKINTYKNYFLDFMATLDENAARKVYYALEILKTQQRVSKKFAEHIREKLYELKAEYEGNIYRIFFIFDEGNIVILFNGFQKKSQKTPENEIETAIKLKNEYESIKRQSADKRR
ncbi:MAG: type II toxin-antitoxin system RelE/ParE family toxin [Tannerella sp.]|jgi:phage-related protein|nr:type II toxin-antitoxin system RelE/ParE family toxin [Tannerella sp.]